MQINEVRQSSQVGGDLSYYQRNRKRCIARSLKYYYSHRKECIAYAIEYQKKYPLRDLLCLIKQRG